MDRFIIVRHGARHDYAHKEAWKARCAASDGYHEVKDPPLSSVGHAQARLVGTFLGEHVLARDAARGAAVTLVCSPYVRAMQTARPTAEILGLPLRIDGAVCEGPHRFPAIAPRKDGDLAAWREQRFVDFTHVVDDTYVPTVAFGIAPLGTDPADTVYVPTEATFRDNLDRLLVARAALEDRYFKADDPPSLPRGDAAADDAAVAMQGRTVVCFTHAATCVGLAAALCGSPLHALEAAAPAGVWILTRSVTQRDSRPRGAWSPALQSGIDHLGEVQDATTSPWTFPERFAAVWAELVAETAAARGHSPSLTSDD